MLLPDYRTFEAMAAGATLVPVAKAIPADLLTPVSAFLSISGKEEHAFLLESVEGGEKIGRHTFLGVRPSMVVTARATQITVQRGKKVERSKGEIFPTLKKIFEEHHIAKVPGMPPFTAGAVGYLAYDAVRQLEKLPAKAKDDLKVPDCVVMFFDRLLAFDHVRQQIFIIATADVKENTPRRAYELATKAIAEMERRLEKGVPKALLKARRGNRSGEPKLKSTENARSYSASVNRIKEYIVAGDVYQAVLSQRLEMEPRVSPFEIYRALRTVNPSPYMYYLKMGDMQVLGSSPEMLVKASSGPGSNGTRKTTLQYRPIAGTRWRGADEAEDQKLAQQLLADEKERAEHVMLVDLGRNDLGRVSEYGSVRVKELMTVERYSHVMHLVSSLESELRQGLHPFDAFASCFPAGTLTGAPKVRAMEVIEELEPVRRGIYGGSVFYADFAGNLDSCIAIRTMLMKGKRAFVQAGAGIVADSVPQREYEESLNKAQALVRAVEIARG